MYTALYNVFKEHMYLWKISIRIWIIYRKYVKIVFGEIIGYITLRYISFKHACLISVEGAMLLMQTHLFSRTIYMRALTSHTNFKNS